MGVGRRRDDVIAIVPRVAVQAVDRRAHDVIGLARRHVVQHVIFPVVVGPLDVTVELVGHRPHQVGDPGGVGGQGLGAVREDLDEDPVVASGNMDIFIEPQAHLVDRRRMDVVDVAEQPVVARPLEDHQFVDVGRLLARHRFADQGGVVVGFGGVRIERVENFIVPRRLSGGARGKGEIAVAVQDAEQVELGVGAAILAHPLVQARVVQRPVAVDEPEIGARDRLRAQAGAVGLQRVEPTPDLVGELHAVVVVGIVVGAVVQVDLLLAQSHENALRNPLQRPRGELKGEPGVLGHPAIGVAMLGGHHTVAIQPEVGTLGRLRLKNGVVPGLVVNARLPVIDEEEQDVDRFAAGVGNSLAQAPQWLGRRQFCLAQLQGLTADARLHFRRVTRVRQIVRSAHCQPQNQAPQGHQQSEPQHDQPPSSAHIKKHSYGHKGVSVQSRKMSKDN